MLGRALLLASPTQACHVFVGMAAIAHLVLVVTDWLYGMYGFGSFVDGRRMWQPLVVRCHHIARFIDQTLIRLYDTLS